ncbi:MAG TPA: YdeI/OmpD-associated family protein [Prolixibacteraceae bacterium]|nr:YdeI/OmpD-associated family protein [Prolixibacteraceae bacterium]
MNGMNPVVDEYIGKITKWQAETEKLREILLNCGLDEALKWGKPCYSFQKSNLFVIQGFKEYFALLFFKGSLLNDVNGILRKTGENTEVGRHIRFSGVDEIVEMEPIVKAYIYEAIEAEKAGLKVSRPNRDEMRIPEEFQQKMDEIPLLKTAFEALTPGRRRAYLLYFAQPKQTQTRVSRIEKWLPQIFNGKGLNE